ncbi:MAG: hypothetical protein J5601_05495 [Elusimicrobiaceae bacterium]|nr:hypothetical protein [Elusimicrobiaceae bacterium]
MKKIILTTVFCFTTAGFLAAQIKLPDIAPSAKAADYSFGMEKDFPNGQPKEKVLVPDELDVRSYDLSDWDFSDYTAEELADILRFDEVTKFPPKNKLPKGFNPKKILKNGKNPGLGLYTLHKKGIDGRGVSIALLDQPIQTNHEEYKHALVWYKVMPNMEKSNAAMHGAALASITVGKKVGVAPKANLFFYAAGISNDATPFATALDEIYELNKQLPPDKKIRAVGISQGFRAKDAYNTPGISQFLAAKKKLEESGVAVFMAGNWDVETLSRNHSLSNPDKLPYCHPSYWWGKNPDYYKQQRDYLTVPTCFRVTASPTGENHYVHYAHGGFSWAVPYIVGMYALAAQVYPNLTKDIFKEAWAETSLNQSCEFEGVQFEAYNLLQPAKLIENLQQRRKREEAQ